MRRTRKLVIIPVAAMQIVSGCAKKKPAAVASNPPAPVEQPRSSTPTATPTRETPPPAPVAEAPKSNFPDAATRARIDQLLAKIEDAYFDYDQHTLRADAVKALESDSRDLRDILKDYPKY